MANTPTLKQLFIERFDVPVSRRHIDQLVRHCLQYELRSNHPTVLNTALLGVETMHFLPKDQSALFEIFNIDRSLFQRCINQCPNIDKTRVVTSDDYNILTVWLAYCIFKSSLPEKSKQDGLLSLFKMLHYKFFSSVVKNSFKFKANEQVMQATIDNLSLKFDIRKPETSTWKLVIEARSRDVFAPDSIHRRTLETFAPDVGPLKNPQSVTYVISDTQTRMRTKLVLIARQYYENKAKNNRIQSSSMVDTIDGEKVLKDMTATFDTMIGNITNQVLVNSRFIRNDYIQLVCKMNNTVQPYMMRELLLKFSNMATAQYQQRKQYETSGVGSNTILLGYYELISNIIQKTYRACQLDGTDMSSKMAILDKTRNMYRSSRIIDEGVQIVKNSVEHFVSEHSSSVRASTNASMKIAFILYIILLSFQYL